MVRFFQRPYPSANSILLTGARPVLVDSGFGSDADALLDWLEAEGVAGDGLALLVNTHHHSDHVGGNHAVQRRFGTTVAASAAEAEAVNRRAPDACEAAWLRQPVEAYTVGRTLVEGDRIETGAAVWDVLETPGHTAGHLSLWCAAEGTLVLGDALHHADVGWLAPLRHGNGVVEQAAATVERLAALPAVVAYSGHGPAITDVPAAFERARRRVRRWRERPEDVAWHACKRVFAHALMLHDGLAEAELLPALLACPWYCDHARLAFGVEPGAFLPMLLREMLQADAAFWSEGRLLPRAAYRAPRPGWLRSEGDPARWS